MEEEFTLRKPDGSDPSVEVLFASGFLILRKPIAHQISPACLLFSPALP